MATIRITKIFFFESAHALAGYDGKCKNIHGHSYQLMVSVSGTVLEEPGNPKNGMVMDFGDLKAIVKREIIDVFDHATILNAGSVHDEIGAFLKQKGHKVIRVNYQPTSELMLVDFAGRIRKHLPPGISLHSLRLYETATSYAEWFSADNQANSSTSASFITGGVD